jgi:hypothetical protein
MRAWGSFAFAKRITGPFFGKPSFAAQQPSGQQSLHVTPAIGNQVDVHGIFHHPVDNPPWFEKGFPIFLDTQEGFPHSF